MSEHGGRPDSGSSLNAEGPAIKPSLRQGFFSIGQISLCERIERLSAFLAYRFNPVSVYCDGRDRVGFSDGDEPSPITCVAAHKIVESPWPMYFGHVCLMLNIVFSTPPNSA